MLRSVKSFGEIVHRVDEAAERKPVKFIGDLSQLDEMLRQKLLHQGQGASEYFDTLLGVRGNMAVAKSNPKYVGVE